MDIGGRVGLSLFAWLALAGCAGAQTSSLPQPWAAIGQWSATVTQGGPAGPVAVDSSGDLLVANALEGVSAPTQTLGDTSAGSSWVSKLNASGASVFGVQVAGVSLFEAIAADSAGNVLVAGYGAAGGLPVTPNAYSSSPSGQGSQFVCKLNGADGTPIFCTYLNSSQISINGIGADASGNVYILAIDLTQSIVTTPGALSLGSRDVVLLKLDPSGQTLLYAAGFGGNGAEGVLDLSVDGDGNAYVTGATSSTNFPGASNGAIPTPSGSFIAKVDPTGSKILYASYGGAQEIAIALTVDSAGAAYVSGLTSSGDLFVRKYTPDGTAVAYENSFPQTAGSDVRGMAVDGTGTLTMLGNAGSTGFPQILPTAGCQAMTETYPTTAAGSYMIRLTPSGSLFQSTNFTAELVFTPYGSGSILAVQQGRGWLATGAADLSSAGVIEIGPASAPISSVEIQCVSNAATFESGNVAPGEMISIFGAGLGPAVAQTFTLDSKGGIASTLGGVQVTFDGTPAPLLYVQDTQINAITTWELAGKSTTEMCVIYNGNKDCVTPAVGAAAPGVFATGQGQAIAVNQDGTLNSNSNPAGFGSIVSLYLTGLGPISPAPADGVLVQFPLPTLLNPVELDFANANVQAPSVPPAEILYAGPAPLEVGGMFQINVRIPEGTTGEFAILIQLPDGSAYYCTSAVAVTPKTPITSKSEHAAHQPLRLGVRPDRIP
jgi:uncharacterized protein (TIGR03437 family)